MLKELTSELIISKDKVKDLIQSMTPKKKKSIDRQFLRPVPYRDAIQRGETMRRLFAEELGFSHVEVHTDLSRKEIKQMVEEMTQTNSD